MSVSNAMLIFLSLVKGNVSGNLFHFRVAGLSSHASLAFVSKYYVVVLVMRCLNTLANLDTRLSQPTTTKHRASSSRLMN